MPLTSAYRPVPRVWLVQSITVLLLGSRRSGDNRTDLVPAGNSSAVPESQPGPGRRCQSGFDIDVFRYFGDVSSKVASSCTEYAPSVPVVSNASLDPLEGEPRNAAPKTPVRFLLV